MRVLDLDLDFFLDGLCDLAEAGTRPGEEEAAPWSEEALRDYLERNLLLSRKNPLPGRVYETHDGSLRFWREKMDQSKLTAPFHVTHVDAHSDLGIGRPGPGYVLYNVLSRPAARRQDIDEFYAARQLDEANYLLFAVAMRMVSSLDDVRRPFSAPDIPKNFVQNGVLQLPQAFPELFSRITGEEPRIPFREYREEEYRAHAPFDFVTLALSPRYAPESADRLADVIREYIREI